MRDLVLAAVLVSLLAMSVARPFVGVLTWSWISFMNPHREVYGFAISMPWAMMVFCATVLGCFLAREPKRAPVNYVTVLLFLLGICVTITSLAALGPSAVVWYKWEKVIKIIMGTLLTAALVTDRHRVHALVWLIVISLGYYGVKGGIFTLNTGGNYIVLGPADSMIGDRNHLAVALLVAVPLMNYLREQSPHRLVRIGLVGAMGLTLLSVIGSQSRGALIGLAATAGMLWLRSTGKIVSGIAIVACLALSVNFMPDAWLERMNTIQDYQEDGSAMGRITIWNTTIQLALMRPLFGGGFEGFYYQHIVNLVTPGTEARAAHSIWFEVLGEHGFPTLFVWAGLSVAGIWYTLRTASLAHGRPELRWAYDLSRMAQVSIAAYLVGGSFLSLSYWDCFWTLLVIMAAVHGMVQAAVHVPRRRGAQEESPRRRGMGAATPSPIGPAAARRVAPR